MIKFIAACFALLLPLPALGANYLLNGRQESNINYQMVQKIAPTPNIRKLILTYVVPESFESPTFNQNVQRIDFRFAPTPSKRNESTDARGNRVVEATWLPPLAPITATLSLNAKNSVLLREITSNAPFPLGRLSKDIRPYLKATEQVASTDPAIVRKAKELTRLSNTEFDAVQRIMAWVVDHMQYVLIPESYDAVYSFRTGKGNCQNYSHLAAALMRAVGIPVRIVNGVTMKEPYDIHIDNAIITMKLAEGRHSWIEVYFPDLGWVPSDAQGSQMFISNRFLRIEVGLDNNDTEQDGLVRWSRTKGSTDAPAFAEIIDAGFDADRVRIDGRQMTYGPRGSLFTPKINAVFSKVTAAKPPPVPVVPKIDLKGLAYRRPVVFGNLEFPENADFLSTRGPAEVDADGTVKAKKNFLVETAEYVTTKGRQYAQLFTVDKPIQLKSIGLALHKFSDDGQLWVELFKDNKGQPGEYIGTSSLITLSDLGFQPGYSWIDFGFKKERLRLPPGRYWIALGFTGSPIVNWFFTYGKPVGPPEGTRYRTLFDEGWSRSLSFEFNYRIAALAGE